jgi:hypothetical protein
MRLSLSPVILKVKPGIKDAVRVRPFIVGSFNAFFGQQVEPPWLKALIVVLRSGYLLFTARLDPLQLLQHIEIHDETVVAALDQLVGDTTQVPIYPLRILQLGIGLKSGFNAPVILPGGGVFSIGGMKGNLVVVEDIGLASSAVRVNFRPALRTVTEKKLPNEPATAEGAQEPALGWP